MGPPGERPMVRSYARTLRSEGSCSLIREPGGKG